MLVRRAPFIAAAAGVLLVPAWATAGILSQETVEVIFAPGKAPPEASWSKGLELGAEGLARAGGGAGDANAWVQMQPIPVGLAWRPPPTARFAVEVLGRLKVPAGPKVLIRHSVDRVHWSDWTAVTVAKSAKEGLIAAGQCELTATAAAKEMYGALREEWIKSDPDWQSDDEECCYWIARTSPTFFDTERPFLGYVQARVEAPLGEGDRLRGLRLEISWGVGGVAAIPKRGKGAAEGKKWCFDFRRTSPAAAWKALLAAMAEGDEAATARLATPEGLRSIVELPGGRKRSTEDLKGLAKAWSSFEVRWQRWEGPDASAMMGPPVKEHGLQLKLTPEGWKLAKWTPGE